MEISITEAKAKLTDLVRQAEEGEDVVLTRHGKPIARIQAVKPPLSYEQRKAVLEDIMATGRANASPGPCAARSQDYLYDEFGLPK